MPPYHPGGRIQNKYQQGGAKDVRQLNLGVRGTRTRQRDGRDGEWRLEHDHVREWLLEGRTLTHGSHAYRVSSRNGDKGLDYR